MGRAKKILGLIFIGLAVTLFTQDMGPIKLSRGSALAGDLVIYPAKGQSQEQLDKDKFECYSWAKGQTGFDPMAVPKATEPPPKEEAAKGGVVRGGVRGAAVGTAAGAIAGDSRADTRKGARVGAATGAIVGGARRRDQQRQQQKAEEDWAKEQAATYTQNRAGYDRAYAACLEGRGYSVK